MNRDYAQSLEYPHHCLVPLSRNDLIVFAILTGSNVVGCGFPHVESQRAIKFIAGPRRTMFCDFSWREVSSVSSSQGFGRNASVHAFE